MSALVGGADGGLRRSDNKFKFEADATAVAAAAAAAGIELRFTVKDPFDVEARGSGCSTRSPRSRGCLDSLGNVELRELEELEYGSEREV